MAKNEITVTSVQTYPIRKRQSDSPMEGFAKVVLNDQLLVNGLRIVRGKNGLFVGFPSEYRQNEDRRYGICHPITKQLHQHINQAVLNHFSKHPQNAVAV